MAVSERSGWTGRRRAGTREELGRRGMEVFGPCLERLPWTGAEAAAKGLGQPERERYERVRDLLDGAWLDDPVRGLVDAMRCACRGTVIVHSGARGRLPSWLIHDYGGTPSTSVPKPFGDRDFDMGAARLYALEGPDPFADRPVNLSTLTSDFEKIPPLHELLSYAGLHHQLRAVTYDANQSLAGYFGTYLPKGELAYTVVEHRLFHAVFPLLRRWLATARLLGIKPLAETGLTTALNANLQPSYLFRDDGVLVFANDSARRLPPSARGLERTRAARSTQLSLPEQLLRLVTLPTPAAPDLSADTLPRALARVRDSIARGLSDKEIADELSMPLSTVRTYVKRVFRKLGVSSRREVMRALTERCVPGPPGTTSGEGS